MSTVSVRYIVDDVDAAIDFYCGQLGFEQQIHPDPAFAMLTRGDLRLVLVSPVGPDHPGGGSRPMPDGTSQQPGGWNRIRLQVQDLEDTIETLRPHGVRFRNELVTAPAASRSWYRTRRETWSSCSSRSGLKRA
jgi:catechol 2,3-dioxygenase-like lactoylglutathione lyase family enzyme